MAKGCAFEELVHEAADGFRVECTTYTVSVHVLLEILFTELEDEDEFSLGVDDVVKANNVYVFELLHERDLADSGGGSAFFSVKMDFLQCHYFISGSRSTLVAISV